MKLTVTVLLFLLAAGCSSPPSPINYYVLDTTVTEENSREESAGATIITLQSLKLARYLDQSSLAMLQGQHGVYYAGQHVWAEPLQHGFARSLANDINKTSAARLILADEPGADKGKYQLQLQIDNFAATQDSRVLLSGKFWLINNDQVLAEKIFNLAAELPEDGYAAAVAQQRELITELAKLIVATIPG